MGTEAGIAGAGKRGKPVFCPVPEMRGTNAQAGRIRRGGDFALEQAGTHEEVQKEIDMPQYEEDVLQRIADGETASEILDEKMPTVRRRFRKATQTLCKIMDEVREEFPDANYYTGGGDGLELLLGQSHSFGGKIQSELIAESGDSRLSVGGGDW